MIMYPFLGHLLLLTAILVAGVTPIVSAQKRAPELQNKEFVAKITADGSFFIPTRDKQMTSSEALDQLREGLGVSGAYDFKSVSESEDALGYRHLGYQSNYAGIPIEEGMVLLHEKNGRITHLNGHVAVLPEDFDTEPTLSLDDAADIARKHLGLASDIPEPQVTLVIARLPAADKPTYVLAYKVSIEGKKEIEQVYIKMNVFVDARSGLVRNKINLIAFTAAPAQAHTLYSGEQTITTESDEDGYLLYDKARKIRTYNFEQATISSSGRIDKLLDYTNPSTTWDSVFALDSVSWLVAGDTTLFPSNGSWTPLFYALTSPTAQFWTQGPIGDPAIRSRTPAQFGNIGLSLNNAPYMGLVRAYNVRNQKFLNVASFTLKRQILR